MAIFILLHLAFFRWEEVYGRWTWVTESDVGVKTRFFAQRLLCTKWNDTTGKRD